MLLTYTAGNEAEKSTAELYKSELAKIISILRSVVCRGTAVGAAKGALESRQDIFVMYWWPDLPSPYSFLYSTFHSEEEPLFNWGIITTRLLIRRLMKR